MTESTYNPYFLYRSGLLEILGMQINNTLILANNNFASIKKEALKDTKIITKDWEYFTSTKSIKFNKAQIKLDSNGIVLTKKSHVGGIFLVTKHDADSTSLSEITKKKLSLKEQYLAQRARRAYIVFVCQPEASFDLFQTAQIVEFLADDIILLNKRLQ